VVVDEKPKEKELRKRCEYYTLHTMRARTHTRTGIDKSTAVCDAKDTVYAPMYSNYKVYVL
jgi:hypothetical protein